MEPLISHNIKRLGLVLIIAILFNIPESEAQASTHITFDLQDTLSEIEKIYVDKMKTTLLLDS